VPVPWKGSRRRQELPDNWPELCKMVAERSGGVCELVESATRCVMTAAEVDHRGPAHDHSLLNLQHLCRRHHARKTGAEGARAVRLRGER